MSSAADKARERAKKIKAAKDRKKIMGSIEGSSRCSPFGRFPEEEEKRAMSEDGAHPSEACEAKRQKEAEEAAERSQNRGLPHSGTGGSFSSAK